MAVNYNKLAAQQYDPGYNEKVTALKNQLADQLNAYDASKTGINTNYNTQVNNQNLANTGSKNNFSNALLGRGIARSTVATSGLAGLDAQNNRLVGDINTARTEALNDVETNKTAAQKSYNTTVAGLNADRLTAIADLARQLKQTDLDNAYRQQQLAQEKELAYAQIRAQRATSAASSSDDVKDFKLNAIAIMNDANLTEAQKLSQLSTLRQGAGVSYSGNNLKDAYNFVDGYMKQITSSQQAANQTAALKARTSAAQKAASGGSGNVIGKMSNNDYINYERSSLGSKLKTGLADALSIFNKNSWSNIIGKY